LLESYGSTEDSRQQYDVLVPLETPYGETSRARIWFLIRHHKMGSSAQPYWPLRSILFPRQNYHNQSIGSALRASPFVSFGTFARKYYPNVGSALRASPFKHCKCSSLQFFAVSMSASRSRTCCARLQPRRGCYVNPQLSLTSIN